MIQNTKPAWAVLVCAVLLTAVGAGLFVYTVQMREPWFGTSPICMQPWMNSAVVLWAKNWYREGPFHLWFGYFGIPRSIEFPTLESRDMYNSYPPGATLPIYLFSRLLGHESSVATVMGFALVSQAMIVAALMTLVFLFARKAGGSLFDAGCLACIPALACLLLPAPAFLFQMAYLHIVVLPVFAVFVLLEFIRDEWGAAPVPRWLRLLQGFLGFYGALCDWLFVFVLACVYLKRLARGQLTSGGWKAALGRTFTFGFGPGLALGMFALTLWHFERFGNLAERFTERSAASSNHFLAPTTKTLFWSFHIVRGYGIVGRGLILGSGVVLLLLLAYTIGRRLLRPPLNPALVSAVSLIFMLLTPCMLHVFVFRQDSSHILHYFTTAKFALVLATVPFVLAPTALLAVVGGGLEVLSPGHWWKRMTGRANAPIVLRWSVAAPLLLALAGIYTVGEYAKTMKQFTILPKLDTTRAPAFLGANTAYDDIVFTPNSLLEIAAQSMGIAYSMKCVYTAASLAAMYETTRGIDGEYVVNLFMQTNPEPVLAPEIKHLVESAFDRRSDGGCALYKIHKSDFLRECQETGLPPR